jgi:cell division transport system ATP-binding protein
VLFATHDRTLLDVRPRRIVVLDEGKATDVPYGLAPSGETDVGTADSSSAVNEMTHEAWRATA